MLNVPVDVSLLRFRLNSLLATYGSSGNDKRPIPSRNNRPSSHERYLPLRERVEREAPRSIKLKPQEYFLFIIAFLAISVLVIYNVFICYYSYYDSIEDNFD